MPTGTHSAVPPTGPLWTLKIRAVEGSDRRFWGEASSPEVDIENEVVDPAGLQAALDAFMHLPVVDFFHTGIPVGLVTKAGWTGPKLRIEGRIKPTPDCDPVWQGILDGVLSELSIWGKRLSGSPECRIPKNQRTRSRPCVTKAIQMYTISICPRGSAVNRSTWIRPGDPDEPLEDLVRKALTSGSALIHPTVDGAAAQNQKDDRTMPNLNRDEDDEQRTTPPAGDQVPLQGGEMPPEDVPPTDDEEIKKTDEEQPDAPVEPTMTDVMGVLERIAAAVCPPAGPGDAAVPGDDLVKAQNRVLEVETENQNLRREVEELKKAIRPPKEIVIDSSLAGANAAASTSKNTRLEKIF